MDEQRPLHLKVMKFLDAYALSHVGSIIITLPAENGKFMGLSKILGGLPVPNP